MTVSRAKRQKETKAQAFTVHKQLHGPFISSETLCKNTLDPCSFTHIAARCPSCCDSDGKDPYYFDRLQAN